MKHLYAHPFFSFLFAFCSILLININSLLGQAVFVKDANTLEPINNVSVFAQGELILTDESGAITLPDLSPSDSISFRHISYRSEIITFREIMANDATIILFPERLDLEEVVISASKWEQSREKVPNKITAISREDISLQQPQTAADLLGINGDVFIQKSQLGGGSPIIRGFAANRILMVVDGVRMNNAIFRSGNLQNVISIDPHVVDRAEIIFGPGSVIYGSDAIGGVMSFQSIVPAYKKEDANAVKVNTSFRYGSANDENNYHFDIQYGKNKWATFTSFSYSNFDDIRMGSRENPEYTREWFVQRIRGRDSLVMNEDADLQRFTGYNQVNFLQKFRFKPATHWDIQLNMHYSETSDIPRYDRLIEWRNGQPRYAEWYYGPQVWLMNQMHLHHLGKTAIYDQAKVNISYQRFKESRNDRNFRQDRLRIREESVDALSLNVDFEKSFFSDLRLFYGLEGIWNEVASTGIARNIESGITEPVASRYPNGSTWRSYAAYSQFAWEFSPKWTVSGGIRYSYVNLHSRLDLQFFPLPFEEIDISDGALNGSLGVVFRALPSLQFNSNISTGFRAPNVDDAAKVFDSEPGSVVVPNPDLTSEYAYNVDIGTSYQYKNRLTVEGTLFYTKLIDALLRRPFHFNGQDSIIYDNTFSQVQAIVNGESASIYGVQLSFFASFHKNLSLRSTYTYTEGESFDGEALRHVVPAFGQTHVIFQRDKLTLDAFIAYQGGFEYKELALSERGKPHIYARGSEGLPYSPSWITLNTKIQYQISSSVNLLAGVENIRDVRYRPYSSGIVAPGRNFIFAIEGTF